MEPKVFNRKLEQLRDESWWEGYDACMLHMIGVIIILWLIFSIV